MSNKTIEIRIEQPNKQTKKELGRVVIIFPNGLRLGGHTPSLYRQRMWFALKAAAARAHQLAQAFQDAGHYSVEVTIKKVVF